MEHYYQAMKLGDPVLRESIRRSGHPGDAQKLAKKNKRQIRKDWAKVKEIYIQYRTHPEAAKFLRERQKCPPNTMLDVA